MPSRKDSFVSERPSLEEALVAAKDAISARRTMIIVGSCRVDYHGRASSMLESGERILIVKEDGSVLVHRPKGYEPVNWQPPGCTFQVYVNSDYFAFKAIRQRPREVITVLFDRIYALSVFTLIDRGDFALHASEEDMQKAILLQPSIIEEGLKPVTYEKKVEPGFIDVYCVDKNGKMVVIEIKRKIAGKEAVLQLAKYVESLKAIVNHEIRGMLVAPKISKGVQKLLVSLGMDFKQLDPKKCAAILRNVKTKKIFEFL